MVCTAKIQDWNGSSPSDIGIQFTGGSGNKSFGMPSGKNDWGMQVTVSGCENHQVILSEHDMNKNAGQNTMVFQNGTHWLHHLYGGTTAAEINEVPLDTKAVGYQDMYYISDYGVTNGMHQLFHGNWQPEQGQFYNQGQLCPGGGEVWPMSMHNEHSGTHNKKHRYACVYPKNAETLRGVDTATSTGSSPLVRPMYEDMVTRYCADSNNTFEKPGADSCLQRTNGLALAKEYCGVGDRIHSDENCNKGNLTQVGYDALAAAYCEANPNDSFCSCYNVLNDKCANDSKTGPAGCSDTASYVDLRNATPDDFKDVWDGQRKCGSVCAGANKYIPANNQAGCKTTIQICKQDINVGSATESEINASCELNAEDGSSAGGGGGAGAGGGGGGGDSEEKLIIPKSIDDIKTFIPKGVDGLKTNRRQQLGVGGVMSVICVILLIVAGIMGTGPVARRFR